MTRVTVLGLGDVLKGDEALGPHVIRKLQAFYQFDDGVSLLDAGSPGVGWDALVSDAEVLIVVDAVSGGGVPGDLQVFRGDEFLQRVERPRLREALLQRRESVARDSCVVGVTPERVEPGVGMSAGVKAAVSRAAEAVIRELARLGHAPQRSWSASQPEGWWEQPATT